MQLINNETIHFMFYAGDYSTFNIISVHFGNHHLRTAQDIHTVKKIPYETEVRVNLVNT